MVLRNKILQISGTAFATLGLSITAATAQSNQSLDDVEAFLGQVEQYSTGGNESLGQGLGASQFSDVSPRDWAFQALDDLTRRYGCLRGYPNGTFRGNRALTRYEFAAGLNACLQQIERLIATGVDIDPGSAGDLDRLSSDFAAELAALGTQVDGLESRVSFLEDNQFSTTTKLTGEVIMAATSLFGADNFTGNQGANILNTAVTNNGDEVTFGYRARLTLNTSFSGEDLLATRLNTGNLAKPTLNSPGSGLFNGIDTSENTQTFNDGNGSNVTLDWLAYYAPLGDGQLFVAANGGIWDDFVPTLSPYFQDFTNGKGAISQFASENPIYGLGAGAGAGLTYPLGDKLNLAVGYLSGTAANANQGVFSGDYAFLGQISGNVTDTISLGLTYVHGYHPTGNNLFDLGVGTGPAQLTNFTKASNSYGAELAWEVSDGLSFSGYFTYTDVIAINSGNGEIWTYGAGLAFPDLGGEGNVLGIFAGAQPYLGNLNSSGGSFYTDDTPYHVEAFYKYQLNDNISITPGVIWLTAPNQIDNDAWVGTLRTTFSF